MTYKGYWDYFQSLWILCNNCVLYLFSPQYSTGQAKRNFNIHKGAEISVVSSKCSKLNIKAEGKKGLDVKTARYLVRRQWISSLNTQNLMKMKSLNGIGKTALPFSV